VHREMIDPDATNPNTLGFDGVSASWLANELDDRGVVRLRDVFSTEWLEAMRASVSDYAASHGDGDVFIPNPDHRIGSPAYRLTSDPALRRLFSDVAKLRRPNARSEQTLRCAIPLRKGIAPKARSNLFHYDASVLTMVIPVFIPHATVGRCGELVAVGNKRPFRRFVATHLIETVLTHNSLYRRYVLKKVNRAPGKYIVDLEPGDAYMFWGYRTYHGNLVCTPGLVRATLVLQFGDVHSGSWLLKAAWRFSRSRRDLDRFQYDATAHPASTRAVPERVA
jgi:hypothetical protein